MQYNAEKVFGSDHVTIQPWLTRLTSKSRVLPSIFIAGVQKGGTTSLYAALSQHPQILPTKQKEVYFFGNTSSYNKGINWYKQFYATKLFKQKHDLTHRVNALSIDASTNTFDSLEAPTRIAKHIPDAKIIILLRNPVKRAFSHFEMATRLGFELADFPTAIQLEETRINTGLSQPLSDVNHNYVLQRLGYKSRGIYAPYIKNWYNTFSAKQILVLSSEFLFTNPSLALNQVMEFLELDPLKPIQLGSKNVVEHKNKMDAKTADFLHEFYQPHNLELFSYLNREFDW